MLDVLEGAYDLHVHPSPDVVPRRFTDLQLAKRYVEAGMKGFGIKSHQLPTAGRAALVREAVPACHAIGTITLNNAVGGLNPMAVEMAARMGAKIVWFPTIDSLNQETFLQRTHAEAPYGATADNKTLQRKRLTILDEKGALKPEVFAIMDVIKAHDMVMATGHISEKESVILVREAAAYGVRKMSVTHVDFPCTRISLEWQKECVRQGAFLGHGYLQIATGESKLATALQEIREIGPEHFLLVSDGGQTNSIPPEEAMETYCLALLNAGFTKREVRRMVVDNPTSLVE